MMILLFIENIQLCSCIFDVWIYFFTGKELEAKYYQDDGKTIELNYLRTVVCMIFTVVVWCYTNFPIFQYF